MPDGAKVMLRYEGQTHQIDFDTLISSLMYFVELTRVASDRVVPGESVQIMINAPEKGSVEIWFEFISRAEGLLAYLNKENIQIVFTVITTVVGLLQLKQYLKGKKPDVAINIDNNTKITIGSYNITVPSDVYDLYENNGKVNDCIEGLFNKLSEKPEIEGFVVEMKGEEPLRIDSSDFPGMSRQNELLEQEEDISKTVKAQVSVVKVVFQRNRKWEFIYLGNKISAEIDDELFWGKIDSSGVRFGKGDVLFVKLEIVQFYDSDARAYLNRRYRVLEILDYKQAPLQRQMDFNDE